MKKFLAIAASAVVAAGVLLSACHVSVGDAANAVSGVVGQAKAAISTKVSNATTSTAVSEDSVFVYFPRAGQDAEGQLIGLYGTAQKTLNVAIYSFTDTKIADAIAAAKKRGVTVRLMTDRESSSNSSQKAALKIVKAAGIPIKENTHSGIMHLKVSIIDTDTVTTGSFNYTKSAQNTNDENLVIIHNSALVKQYQSEFDRMWNDTSAYANWND